MKKVTLLFIFIMTAALMATAQVTSLNENFDAACGASTPAYPAGWIGYNQYYYSSPSLNWNCTPEGRSGTPGMQCSGTNNGVTYTDTAWLFTPELQLGQYPGKVYFQFDAKYNFVAGKISVLKTTTNMPDSLGFSADDITDSANPNVFISPIDSGIWITYQIDITAFKSDDLYMAFRYTSTTDSAGVWTIDNVLVTDVPLAISNIKGRKPLSLTVVGNSTADHIKLLYALPQAGTYKLTAYDMMGRQLYHSDFYANTGAQTYDITGLHLSSGMYFIKMENGKTLGTVKTIVQ